MAPELRPDIETLALAIAGSPIVVARAFAPKALSAARPQLPEGFDDADLAVLRWIAEEARRVGRRFARI